MADTGLRMNFAALKRADPYAKEILDSATHVALYTFEENEWEKTNIEGALFVYSRNGEPFHSLVIMNRLSTNNLVEPISKGIELQLKEPFLLYRNAKSRIYGIWFYDKDECVKVAAKLNSLVKDCVKQPVGEPMAQNPNYGSAPSNAPVDIFSMLSKAQDDFNSNQGGGSNKCDVTPSRGSDMASQSVMDFFAKAGGGTSVQMPAVSSLPSPGIFGPRQADAREVPQLLQRLMSNPAHSVEHIEKQQRSVTPQEGQNGHISLSQNCGYQLNSTLIENQTQHRILLNKPPGLDTSDMNGLIPLENELSMMHMSSPKASSPLASYINLTQDINHMVSYVMANEVLNSSSGSEQFPKIITS